MLTSIFAQGRSHSARAGLVVLLALGTLSPTQASAAHTSTLTAAAGTGNTVGVPASATGTIANQNLAGPTLTLTKISQGGVGAFTFTGTNGWVSQAITTTTSGVGVSGATQTLAAAGVVTTLTEAAPAGYALVSANCTGMGPGGTATLSGNTLTLNAAATAAGANIACSFTNVRLPTLTLTKISQGGVGTFTFTGTNGWMSQAITTTTPGVGVSGAIQTLAAAGVVTTLTEAAPASYALVSANCSGMGPGGTATLSGNTLTLSPAATAAGANIACTFTNVKLPTLTLTKISQGGVGAFTFTGTNGWASQTITTTTSGTGVSGASQSLAAAGVAASITEALPPGYALVSANCTGMGPGGTATLSGNTLTLNAAATAAGANIACSFTNVRLPTLTLTKISQGGVGTFTFSGTNGWMSQAITTTTSGVGVSGATQTLSAAGVVTTLTEAAPAGYALVSANCTGMGPGGTATLSGNALTLSPAATAAGANIACTFTNVKLPTLTLAKISNGRVGAFTFIGTNGWASQTITTTTPGVGVAGATQTLASPSASTSISENPASGFLLAGATCTGMGPGGMAVLSGNTLILNSAATAAGADIVCTFTNDDNLTDAVNDAYGPLDGATGGTTPSVLLNDTVGGNPATVGAGGNVVLTPGLPPTPPAGSIAMNADGTITVAPGTKAGSYAYPYSLCAVADPTNCDTATAMLAVSAAPIDAVDDAGTVSNGATGGVAVANVLTNDTLNGSPATLSRVMLAQTATTHPNVTLNPTTGEVRAAPGTPAGTHTVGYEICEILNPTNCDSASVVVTVTDAPPVASNSSLTVSYRAPATSVPLSLSGGAPTSLAITTPAIHGSALVSGLTVTYQPTPGYAGPDSFGYTASNAGGTSAAATVSITVQDPVITITPSAGFSAAVPTPYTQTFTFNGGAPPWSDFQVTNLPAGLSVTATTASTVTISGTPTQAGTFNLGVSATDSSTGNGPYAVGQGFALTVSAPTLALAPANGTAFTGTYDTPFAQTFAANGGVGPYTYAVTAGTLPTDLMLDPATGVLSGTPRSVWNSAFAVTATDTGSSGSGSPFTVTQTYSFSSGAPTVTVSPAVIPNATPTVAYSQQLTASGGVGPYQFQLGTGSLPPGITLSSTGLISGTTLQVGSNTFSIRATDANGFAALPFPSYSLVVDAPALSMTPAAGTLAAAYAAPYSQAFTAAGGSGSFSYTLSGTLPAGLGFDGATGRLSGTPTAPGSYPITVTATDAAITGTGAPFTVAHSYTLVVAPGTITLSPATLPAAAIGTAYSPSLTASGGVAPYSYSVTSGTLPAGLGLAGSGSFGGTPTAVGTFAFTVTAQDANGQSGSLAYTITVAAPGLALVPAAGTLTANYLASFSQAFSAGGGTGPYTYSLVGSLPAGLSLGGNALSGTPTASGSFSFSITATDNGTAGAGAPFCVTQAYTLNVDAGITLAPASLPAAGAGSAYTQTLSASGGAAPYTFSLSAGSLPSGLSLATDGTLAGTPTASGSFVVTVKAVDANAVSGSASYTLVANSAVLALTPTTLPGASAGLPYAQTLGASGGVAPYAFTVTAGSLPPGLSLASSGALAGTPTAAGTFAFTVTATDSTSGSAGSGSQAYSLVVAAPTIAIAASFPPATVGQPYSAAATASGGTAPYGFSLAAGTLPPGLSLDAAGQITGTPTLPGSVGFTLAATDANGFRGTAAATLNVQSAAVAAATPVPLDARWALLLIALSLTALGARALGRSRS